MKTTDWSQSYPSGVTSRVDPGQVAHDGKHIVGSKVGSARPQMDSPRLLSLYRDGRLKLDELVSDRYGLDDINDAIASGARGDAIRNIITFYPGSAAIPKDAAMVVS